MFNKICSVIWTIFFYVIFPSTMLLSILRSWFLKFGNLIIELNQLSQTNAEFNGVSIDFLFDTFFVILWIIIIICNLIILRINKLSEKLNIIENDISSCYTGEVDENFDVTKKYPYKPV